MDTTNIGDPEGHDADGHDAEGSSAMPAVLLGALFVYFVLLGGSEVGVFAVPIQILNAGLGAALVAWWFVELRRGADSVDRLAIGALLLYIVACLAGDFLRQSLDAALAAIVWAAAFGVARRVLWNRRHRVLAFRLMAVCGVVLGAWFLFLWGGVWLEWFWLTAGPPPLDLALPAHIYRHYYVVAMLLASLVPACVVVARDGPFRVAGAIAIAILTLLASASGSRTVWLGAIVAVAVTALLSRPSRRVVGLAGLGIAGAAVLVIGLGLAGVLLDRFSATGTASYRLDVWESTLQLFLADPLSGVGPGSFGSGIALTDLTSGYLFTNRHADNAAIQLAGEAGILGIGNLALLLGAMIVGRRIGLVGSRAAIVGLVLIGAFSLTNNPMDSPNLVAVTIAYAALLVPYERKPASIPGSVHAPARAAWVATWVASTLVAVAVAATHVAALAHSAARVSADAGSWIEARDALATAVTLDPSMALYRREYGVVLAATGDSVRAEQQLRVASSINPADTTALRALALLGSESDRERYAMRATSVQPLFTENWLTLAMVAAVPTGALSEALRVGPWLPGSERWADLFPADEELTAILEAAALRADEDPVPRGSMSRAWHEGVQGQEPPAAQDPAAQAITALLRCDLARASELYGEMGRGWSGSPSGIVGRIMLAHLNSEDAASLLKIATLRNPSLGAAARGTVAPHSLFADPITDAQLYRRLGLGRATPGAVVPRTTDSLGAWMASPVVAAQRGAPDAGLADCQGP